MSDKFEYGTGRRKTATARTRVYAGSGNITVNGRAFEDYFPRKTLAWPVRPKPCVTVFPAPCCWWIPPFVLS